MHVVRRCRSELNSRPGNARRPIYRDSASDWATVAAATGVGYTNGGVGISSFLAAWISGTAAGLAERKEGSEGRLSAEMVAADSCLFQVAVDGRRTRFTWAIFVVTVGFYTVRLLHADCYTAVQHR